MQCNVLVNSDYRLNGLLLGLLDMILTDEDFVRTTALSRHIVDYSDRNPIDRPIPSLEAIWGLARDFSGVQADEAFEELIGGIEINEIPTIGQLVHDPEFGVMVMPKDWEIPS